MQTKEPYYDNDVTQKLHICLRADHMKILPSCEFPVATANPVKTPSLRSRRLSMEPYYETARRETITSTSMSSKLSSYAHLSDVFDYHYIDKLRLEDHENAIVSDSDTDYDELEDNECFGSDSDVDSDLEDYKVHFLMFKVNSRAQFTKPPRTSFSSVSDDFDSKPTGFVMDSTCHPKFVAPEMKFKKTDLLDEPVEDIVAAYNWKCNNPLEEKVETVARAPKVSLPQVSDWYVPTSARLRCSDAYDSPHEEFFL